MKPSEWIKGQEVMLQARSHGTTIPRSIVRAEAIMDLLDILFGEVDTTEKPLLLIGEFLARPVTNPDGTEGCTDCGAKATRERVERHGLDSYETVFYCVAHEPKAMLGTRFG